MVVVMVVVMIVFVVMVMVVVMIVFVIMIMIVIVVVVFIFLMAFRIKNKFFRPTFATEFQVFKQSRVCEVKPMRILPVKFCNFL